MCEDRTMKKLAPLFVVLLSLLMQVRVAYACEAAGFGASEACDGHSLLADAHPDAPSDRGDRCDRGLELAVRGGRTCTDLVGLLVQPGGVDVVALPVVAPALAGTLRDQSLTVPVDRARPVAATGRRLWLETARLRL